MFFYRGVKNDPKDPLDPKQRIKAFLAGRSFESDSKNQEHAQPSVETGNTPETDPEAHRIAGELVKLHHVRAIKTKGDASFYANLIRDFDATYAGPPGAATEHPPVDRVPDSPRGISPQERMEFYRADLARAFGEEFIDRDFSPRPGRSPKKRQRGTSLANLPDLPRAVSIALAD
jgi:hypothetical protein